MILPFLKPIEHLILDDSISEVMINGADRVFIEKAGFLQQVQGVSLGERALMVAVKNIARRLGDDISEAKPILDSRLPDGSRVAAVIPPCSLTGVTLTIRKFNAQHFEMEDLIHGGTLDRALANRLENYVIALFWARSVEPKPSISCNSSTPDIRALFRRFTLTPQSKDWLDLPAASFKAGSNCLIAQSRPTSAIP
jgi:type IV secretory pathway ATPase VirB11/archaellum biosynthesis ATPase